MKYVGPKKNVKGRCGVVMAEVKTSRSTMWDVAFKIDNGNNIAGEKLALTAEALYKNIAFIALMIIGPMPVYPVLGHVSMFPRPTESLVHPRAGFRGWALCGVEEDII